MASIPLKSWELLIRAAEIGSVQQAAENLELDPTTAGRMLGKLEQWLGRSLYVRRMRPFTLTEA
ncbi:MAG TPA: LysR family transcriptional regulator, partial [Sutterella sp.]|nr:LysR family transcriptional regulator [Sutterella sp.]